MISTIELEINQRLAEFPNPLRTLYFGGGTPSIVNPSEIEKLIQLIKKNPGKDLEEVTLECNPDDITKERLQAWSDMGITRLSLGIQSLVDGHLAWMNRSHSAQQAYQSLEWIADSSIREVSVDIIYGFAGLQRIQLQSTLLDLLAFPIHHLSAYALTIEPKTVLHHRLKNKLYSEMPDEEVVSQQHLVRSLLIEHGWEQYEISNFCKPGFEAKHNSQYWTFTPYVGLGPAAHSFDGRKRRWNLAHNPGYIRAIQDGTDYYEEEILTNNDLYNEYIMVSLRRIAGISWNDLSDRFPEQVEHFKNGLSKPLSEKLLVEEDNHIRLTEKGLSLADRITSDFFIT